MKKAFIVIMTAIILTICCACASNPVERYDNFLNDLDVLTRMQTALQQTKDGGEMTFYVREDMKTLEEDLQTLKSSDQEIIKINECFLDAARALQQSAACMEDADEAKAASLYEIAKTRFGEGFLQFALLEPGGGGSGE